MIKKEKIEKFIETGDIIKQTEFHQSNASSGLLIPDYISGPTYDKWMNDIKLFTERNLVEHPLYDEIIECYNGRSNSWGTTKYDDMMSFLNTLADDEELYTNTSIPQSVVPSLVKLKKLFISHSSEDIEYVKPFVQLLDNIGFIGRGIIFCSSIPGYGIPQGENIYNYLKAEFNHDVFLISMLSKNYYSSAASLNEMGAAWVTSTKQHAILLPEFEYSQISGAIDPLKIWMKLNDKIRLNELKNILFKEFSLPEIDENHWEELRDTFIEQINKVMDKYKYKSILQKADLESVVEFDDRTINCVFRFKNDASSPVACSKICLTIYGYNGIDSYVELKYSDMKDYKIYGQEHRRIIISVPKDSFSNFETFDFNSYKSWEIKASWTTCI